MIQTHHNTEDYECTPLISVIVPVYKVEKYIRKCLNSLQAQTYRNIEVLLVDDGSPDACGEICEAFARQDSRFRVIHQKNQGQAAARNNAVQEAAGEYIMFVDSDDFIVPECVDYLVRLLRKYNADVSVGGFYYYYEGTAVPTYRDTEKVFKMNAQEALIRMNYTQGFGAMPWAKLYKKELVLAHPFPVGVIYEDLATLYRIICDTKKVVFGTRKIYYWVQRQGSTMRMQFDERQLYGIQAVKDQYKYVKNRFPGALPSVKARYVGKIMELMAVAFHSENSRVYFVNLKKELRYVNEVLHDPRVKNSMKIRLIAVKMGYLSAKFLFSIHEKIKKIIVST